MNECHSGNPVCPHSYLPLHPPSSLPHPCQRAAVSRLGFDGPCGRDHRKSFVHAPSSRKKRFRQSTSMFLKAAKEEISLIPRVTFSTLFDWWGVLPHFSLLWVKPPTLTYPILLPWEMWEAAGRNRWGVPRSAKGGEWVRIGLSHLLSTISPDKTLGGLTRSPLRLEMDRVPLGSPLSKSWNSQSLWSQMKMALKSPGCVSCHFGASLWWACVFPGVKGRPISDC